MKKKIIITTTALLLCLTVSIGLATAYFTDYESAKGGAIIHLKGQTELVEEMDGNNKNITVVNTGETDMIVRVMIYGDENHMKVTAPDDWYKGNDGAYYYKKVLKGAKDGSEGEATSTLHAAITVHGDEDIQNFDIVVVQEGSRVVYDGSRLVSPDGWDASAVAQIKVE